MASERPEERRADVSPGFRARIRRLIEKHKDTLDRLDD